MAGYSETPLERKLGVRPDLTVFLDRPPTGFALDAAVTKRLPRSIDLALTFHTEERLLERRMPRLVERLAPAGALWICWPKKTARQLSSDLEEGAVRRIGLAAGLVDVKVAAIDDVWSGLKFVRRLADR